MRKTVFICCVWVLLLLACGQVKADRSEYAVFTYGIDALISGTETKKILICDKANIVETRDHNNKKWIRIIMQSKYIWMTIDPKYIPIIENMEPPDTVIILTNLKRDNVGVDFDVFELIPLTAVQIPGSTPNTDSNGYKKWIDSFNDPKSIEEYLKK